MQRIGLAWPDRGRRASPRGPLTLPLGDVRFDPHSGLVADIARGPKSAITGSGVPIRLLIRTTKNQLRTGQVTRVPANLVVRDVPRSDALESGRWRRRRRVGLAGPEPLDKSPRWSTWVSEKAKPSIARATYPMEFSILKRCCMSAATISGRADALTAASSCCDRGTNEMQTLP